MPNTPANANEKKQGRLRKWVVGIYRQQAGMAYPPHLAQFNREVLKSYKGFFSLKIEPSHVEPFEVAVARQKLTHEFLAKKLSNLKNMQIAMYSLAAVVFVYSIWLLSKGSLTAGIATIVWSLGIAVRGYLFAFRAWQIQNRALIRLQDAIKIPGTYLVL